MSDDAWLLCIFPIGGLDRKVCAPAGYAVAWGYLADMEKAKKRAVESTLRSSTVSTGLDTIIKCVC